MPLTVPDPIEEAERAGIDLSLVRENLRLTYTERFEQHQRALNLVLELQRAGRQIRGETG